MQPQRSGPPTSVRLETAERTSSRRDAHVEAVVEPVADGGGGRCRPKSASFCALALVGRGAAAARLTVFSMLIVQLATWIGTGSIVSCMAESSDDGRAAVQHRVAEAEARLVRQVRVEGLVDVDRRLGEAALSPASS